MATASKKTASLVVEVTHERDTKGTKVYADVNADDPTLRSLYLPKHHAEKLGTHQRLRVTIEVIE